MMTVEGTFTANQVEEIASTKLQQMVVPVEEHTEAQATAAV